MRRFYLIFFAAFLALNLVAVAPCASELAKLNRDAAYSRIGIELKDQIPKVKAILESTPAFLISPKAPSFEELEKADLHRWKIPPQLKKNYYFADFKNYVPVLKLFQSLKEDADYLFVGNGYYIPYLMARSLFSGTPMESRIKFVAFSRPLSKDAVERPQSFSSYFDTLDVASKKRKLVVIDSISSLGEANNHSVIRTSNALRKYLMNRGWSQDEALKGVITFGMPEGDPEHLYRAKTLEDYFQQISKIDRKNLDEAMFPYFDPGITYADSPFEESYDYVGNSHYWNGKYASLDVQGMPRGIEDIRNGLARLPSGELEDFLSDRAEKASFFKEVINYGKTNSKLFTKEIQEALKAHGLK
jgi:hypothetical protein